MNGVADRIRFVNTADGVRIAWTVSGSGPPLVKAANWLTHLEYDRDSLVWSHWQSFLERHFTYYRHDERGVGMSDHDADDLSYTTWQPDLEAVVAAAKPEKPFVLLGISQGAGPAMGYAARYPEHVSRLIIYGGYLRGWGLRSPEEKRRREAICELVELGWGTSNAAFRRVYTSMFLPQGTDEQLEWFDRTCARCTPPSVAARVMREQGRADFSDIPAKVTVPTLVVHCRDDGVVPCSQGVQIASEIRNAEFVGLDSCNHILLPNESAWDQFQQLVLEFTGTAAGLEDAVFQTLSQREREVLAAIANGKSNADIAEQLFISEKTVKNHVTHIFEKIHVANRSQAIVKARDGGFRA